MTADLPVPRPAPEDEHRCRCPECWERELRARREAQR